jgi:hypothetical protein
LQRLLDAPLGDGVQRASPRPPWPPAEETFDAEEVDSQSDDIAALATSLRESSLFRPLFQR